LKKIRKIGKSQRTKDWNRGPEESEIQGTRRIGTRGPEESGLSVVWPGGLELVAQRSLARRIVWPGGLEPVAQKGLA